MLVFQLIVFRMLFIHTQMESVNVSNCDCPEQRIERTWTIKTAKFLVSSQNCFIGIYFAICTLGVWVHYILLVRDPYEFLTEWQNLFFLCLSLFKFFFDMGILIFMVYLITRMRKYFQVISNQESTMQFNKKHSLILKWCLILIILFNMTTITLNECLRPVLYFFYITTGDSQSHYHGWIMKSVICENVSDFLACMIIMFLIH